MKQQYENHKFGDQAKYLIIIAENILTEYANQGYRLTLRQLYYQFVARDLFPEDRTWAMTGNGRWIKRQGGTKNAFPNYKWLGGVIVDARMAGLLDWDMIEDRGWEPAINSHWQNPGQIVQACASQFRLDHWTNQKYYGEVMVEKDALAGILEPVCRKWDVVFTANKGYSSASAMKEAGQRFMNAIEHGKKPYLFYLGDHDPSGMDMTRDVGERITTFILGEQVKVVRLALNMNQVQRWNPPENPAKENDSRFDNYQELYGDKSWELDAVEPRMLASLVENAIKKLINQDAWDRREDEQDAMRDILRDFAAQNPG